MKWIYLWYLRIRYFNRVFTITTKTQFKALDIVVTSNPRIKSICIYPSIPNGSNYYNTKFIWKD
jgi:hypothetical protein